MVPGDSNPYRGRSVVGGKEDTRASRVVDDKTVPIPTLVVDDSARMLSEMCRYVEALPSLDLVGTAVNGKDAIDKCASLGPQLILMDFQMPEMNGLEAASRIKSDGNESVRIIMVTIHDNPRLRDAVLSSGVDGFLSKIQLRKDLPKELSRLFPQVRLSPNA